MSERGATVAAAGGGGVAGCQDINTLFGFWMGFMF